MPKQGPITKLLAGLEKVTGSPQDAGVMGLAQGLLAASAPHMLTPVSMGQALGMGMQGAQAYRQASLANAIQQEAMLPYQTARSSAVVRALQKPHSYAARTLVDNMLGGQAAVTHDPRVVGPATAAQSANQFHTVGANARGFGPVGAPSAGAQAALPTATSQAPGGGPVRILPGALPALAGTSGATAGGAAAATYPFQQGLKLTGYYSSPETNVAGFNIPAKPTLNLGTGPYGPPTYTASQPAPAAATAGAATRASVGLTHPGMSPSQITGQTTAQKNATDQLNADIQAGQEAQQQIANLQELSTVASNVQTGPGAEGRIAVEKALASIPGFAGMAQKLNTITNAQIFSKTALNLSLQTVSSAGQHAYDAFKSVMNAFPELSKTNMANAVVTGSLLATARYKAARGQFAGEWQKANNGMGFVKGRGTANAQWAQHAPFMTFFLDSLPPEAVAMLMQKARTNATLRNEILKARKGYQWLQQNVPGYGG